MMRNVSRFCIRQQGENILVDMGSLLRAASFRPDRLSFPDAWCGHVPFAAWLIQILRPSIFIWFAGLLR